VSNNPNASAQMKIHWARCAVIANMLGVKSGVVNKHWSCCLKAAWGDATWAGAIPAETASKLHEAYTTCAARRAAAIDRDARDYAKREVAAKPRFNHRPKPEPTPETDLHIRIKIMLWAIKKCGGIEKAEDALKRAVRSLEDT